MHLHKASMLLPSLPSSAPPSVALLIPPIPALKYAACRHRGEQLDLILPKRRECLFSLNIDQFFNPSSFLFFLLFSFYFLFTTNNAVAVHVYPSWLPTKLASSSPNPLLLLPPSSYLSPAIAVRCGRDIDCPIPSRPSTHPPAFVLTVTFMIHLPTVSIRCCTSPLVANGIA